MLLKSQWLEVAPVEMYQHCCAQYSGEEIVWVLRGILGTRINKSRFTEIKFGSTITFETLSPTQEWALFGFECLWRLICPGILQWEPLRQSFPVPLVSFSFDTLFFSVP